MDAPSPINNVNIRSAIWRMFRDAADEDYLVARMAARSRLPFQFCWSSQQAIEKYLKAALLLNGHSVTDYGHSISDMLKVAYQFSEDLLPDVLCPPKSFRNRRDAWQVRSVFEPLEKYVERVQDYGDPNNRYRVFSIWLDWYDLNKLDQTCFLLRRVAFPLEIELDPPHKTAKQFLQKHRDTQIHSKMAFEGNLHRSGSNLIEETFKWRNFSFFHDQSVEVGKVAQGQLGSNSAITNLLNNSEDDFSASHWLAAHAVPRRISKEVKDEIAKRRNLVYPKDGKRVE